jgi:hypothetical protein
MLWREFQGKMEFFEEKKEKKEGDGNDGLAKPSPYISFMGSVLP